MKPDANRCEICGEPLSSSNGTHPQCVQRPKSGFQVWLRPLGDKCRVRAKSQASARWLLSYLDSLTDSPKCHGFTGDPRGYHTFNVPLTNDMTHSCLQKILRELEEVILMSEPA